MVQDFSARDFASARSARPLAPINEATDLVSRYPNLSEIELARLINLYRSLSALDAALMISDEELGPKLDRFRDDQRSRIRTPFRQYAVLVWIAIAGIIVTAWALAFGA